MSRVPKNIQRPEQRLYDLKAAAKYLGCPLWTIRELIWSRDLPVVRWGRKQYMVCKVSRRKGIFYVQQ